MSTELVAAAAGAFVAAGALALLMPRHAQRPPWLALALQRETELGGGSWRFGLLVQAAATAGAGAVTVLAAGVPVLGLGTAVLALAAARTWLSRRRAARRRGIQDDVLESVRLLRGLLEAGGIGVQQALAVLAERGPVALRPDFGEIAAAATAGRQPAAWASAQARLDDPLFDMLAAAVEVQRPAGGALAPLFADLEEAVTALHEVVREAEALQAQARAAAALVVALPVAFLLVLGAMRSPYLDAYRTLTGGLFLAAALAAIAGGYAWMLAWLRLPPEPRLGRRG